MITWRARDPQTVRAYIICDIQRVTRASPEHAGALDGVAGGAAATVPARGNDGAEVAEDRVQVVTYAAAVDVAKRSEMVCARVPGSRPDRRRQKVWRVGATFKEVIALMDHLRCEGIQRLVLENTSVRLS